MKILCLGTAGYHPSETRQTSCYFLPEAGIVLDAGTGFFRLPPHLQTDWLDIFLSHSHLDHVAGLTFLLDVLFQRPIQKVRVWGCPEKLNAIRQHLFNEHIFPVQLDVEWLGLSTEKIVDVGLGGRLRCFPLEHPGGSLGFRIDWPDGRSIAYVTDTTGDVHAPYVEVIRGSELLLHECNFRDEGEEWAIKTGHTWTTRAAEVAVAAGVKRLVLTHMNPIDANDQDPIDLEIARRTFPHCEIAHDHMSFDF